MEGRRSWLGNVQSDGEALRFFGTGGPQGVWMATSADGQAWKLEERREPVPGADPGAVKLKDGGWLLVVTGPPRERRRVVDGAGRSPLMGALDANGDGALDEREIEGAAAALRKLDRTGDGRLSSEELRPGQR
jgi:hypothetical protein